jgi:UDP-N-acetylglucosamine 2-epimerase (non-hydrolysing)
MGQLKVMTILGTRPEIIRLSRVIALLEDTLDHTLVHTGQNYDRELNEVFFEDLGLRAPDHYLGAGGGTVGATLGVILTEVEKLLLADPPDAVLILGDTNSALAGIIVKRLRIPLFHMEAGNRCFDANVPEELNRKIVDRISDFNLVYTEHARRHLLSEGFPHRRIYLTGSPMKEVLDHYQPQIDRSKALQTLKLQAGDYYLVSVHREENVDSRRQLARLVQVVNSLAERDGVPVVVSTHPRTRDRLAKADAKLHEGVALLKPFGFLDYNQLQQQARCVLSDSGTISEESAISGFPAVTVRTAMERPEALDTGSIILAGTEPQAVLRAVDTVVAQFGRGWRTSPPAEYLIENVSQRVVNLIIGTAGLSNRWDGIFPEDYI